MVAGVESLALRYLVSLGVGYLAYLVVVRLWAAWLLGRDTGVLDISVDLADVATSHRLAHRPGNPSAVTVAIRWRRKDFGRAGASGDFCGG